ncbi:MAG: hypothetical protein L0229_01875 [Blastocatellia bacterium]|nr:hypothetical protein [Blastocatellia bacterium]
MKKKSFNLMSIMVLFLLAMLVVIPFTEGQADNRKLSLDPAGPGSGAFGLTGQTGDVRIMAKPDRTTLKFSLSGLTPNAVYGVWLVFDTSQPPFVPGSPPNFVAVDQATGTTATVYDFTPAAADDAGFTAGNGLDPNGFIVDGSGRAKFSIELNYNIFQQQVSPVVLRGGASQSLELSSAALPCAASSGSAFAAGIDSAYMRVFDTSTVANQPNVSPSFQVLDGPLKPRLVRATVRSIVVVEHFDGLTHGHIPAVSIGASSCGDFVGRLSGLLANATP